MQALSFHPERPEPDLTDERMPMLAIDGKSYTWDEFGKMLMHYEGFHMKLELVDPYDELEWDDSKQKKEQEQ